MFWLLIGGLRCRFRLTEFFRLEPDLELGAGHALGGWAGGGVAEADL